MTIRNLTELFVIMRNNASKNKTLYASTETGDGERLLKQSLREAEEGLEMRDDYVTPPSWIDKLEEAQYTISKIRPKLDELGSRHARKLLRPNFEESTEEDEKIEELSQEIAKLITSTHRHIQCIRSSLGVGSKIEQRLTQNVINCLLLQLQDLSNAFRATQNSYMRNLNDRDELSQKYFDGNDFTNIDLGAGGGAKSERNVDTFDNFLQPPQSSGTAAHNAYLYNDELESEQIDEHFQRPIANRMTQQQLLLFEEENTKLASHREQEVNKIVKSIFDLNDIFKDLSQMVQDQGTVLDRIDYNVEQTQTRVSEGLRQLQKAEMYQRKNRKMCIIMVLAAMTLFMLLLLIFTKL